MNHEIEQFIAVGVLLGVATLFGVLGLIVPSLLGKRRTTSPVKDSPYECGMPVADQRMTFSVKFYLVAMLFILFDIEVLFVISWATTFRDLVKPIEQGGVGHSIFWSMLVFLTLLEVGHFYVWRRGALTWGEASRLRHAQQGPASSPATPKPAAQRHSNAQGVA